MISDSGLLFGRGFMLVSTTSLHLMYKLVTENVLTTNATHNR